MTEHYFSEQPRVGHKKRELEIEVAGRKFSFETDKAVFSPKKFDLGTAALVKYMQLNGRVLDLGCGYGIVGVVAASEGFETTMSDVNTRAVALAKKNVRGNKVKASVKRKDGVPDGEFDTVLFNPPISAGKEIVFRLLKESFEHLAKNGSLQVVARSQKGGKSISAEMERVFGNVSVIGKQSGFHVYKSVKSEE